MKRKVLMSIISPPGGGKSTILRKLSEEYGVPILSSGDIARQMQEDIEKDFLTEGDFAPEEEMRKRLSSTLHELFRDNNVVLADGFPRFIEQCQWLGKEISYASIVLYHLDVPLDTVVERLKERGRSDDKLETIRARLNTYTELTGPIIKYQKVPRFNYDFAVQVILAAKQSI